MLSLKETPNNVITPDTTATTTTSNNTNNNNNAGIDYQSIVDGLIDNETRTTNLLILYKNKDNIPNLVNKLTKQKNIFFTFLFVFFVFFVFTFTKIYINKIIFFNRHKCFGVHPA